MPVMINYRKKNMRNGLKRKEESREYMESRIVDESV